MTSKTFLQLADLGRSGQDRAILQALSDIVIHVKNRPEFLGRVLASPEMDKLALEIGARILKSRHPHFVPAGHSRLTVILATELFAIGGHSRIVEDYLRILGPERCIVVVTQRVFHGAGHAQVLYPKIEQQGCRVIRLYRENIHEAAGALIDLLVELAPETVHLFNHHEDAAIIAASQPELAGCYCYYHHCDHQLALGNFIPHAIHVDPHGSTFRGCREGLGIERNYYIPLSVPERKARPSRMHGRVRTCACGDPSKFFSATPGPKYAEVVPEMLLKTGGLHFHIGPLLGEKLDAIRKNMTAIGVSPEQFIHVPNVFSLHDFLVEHDIDFFLFSFPIGGARAALEAYSAAVPVLYPPRLDDWRDGYDLPLRGALRWNDAAELAGILESVSRESYRALAEAAYDHFLQHHTEAPLRDFLESLPGIPAPLEPYGLANSALPLPCRLEDFLDNAANGIVASDLDGELSALVQKSVRQAGAISREELSSGRATEDRAAYEQAAKLIRDGHEDAGKASLLRLAQAQTSCWEVYHDLGIMAYSDNDAEGAKSLLEAAVQREPVPGLATRSLAALYAAMGNPALAVGLYEKVIRHDPDDQVARESIALLSQKITATGGQLPGTREHLETGAASPAPPAAGSAGNGDAETCERAARLIAGGNRAEGAKLLISMVEGGTGYWRAYNDLAVLAVEQNDQEGALTLFELAVKFEPKPGRARFFHAAYLAALGQVEQALSTLLPLLHQSETRAEGLKQALEMIGQAPPLPAETWVRLLATESDKGSDSFRFSELLRLNPNLGKFFLWKTNPWPSVGTPLRLHIGCGENILPGFTNVDFLPHDARVSEWNLLGYWPEQVAGRLEAIFSEDVLEHFFLPEQLYILCSANLALRKEGCCRVLMPSSESLVALTDIPSGERREQAIEFMRQSFGVVTPYDAVNYGMRFSGHRWLHNHESFQVLAEDAGFEYRQTSCSDSSVPYLNGLNLRNESNSLSFAADLLKHREIRHHRVPFVNINNADYVEELDEDCRMFRATNHDAYVVYDIGFDIPADKIVLINFRSVNFSQFFEHNFAKAYFFPDEKYAWNFDATLRSAPFMNIVTGRQLRLRVKSDDNLRLLRFDPSERDGDFFSVGSLEVFFLAD